MLDTIDFERNVRRACHGGAVKLDPADAARNATWILHPDFVRGRMIPKMDGVVWPRVGTQGAHILVITLRTVAVMVV
jgi:hypothetical protein